MAVAGKSKLPWILGGIAAFFILCCGGFGALTCWGVKKGFDSAAELSPLASDILTNLSASNYEFESVKDKFDSNVFHTSELASFQTTLHKFRDKLGKFESIGDVKGFHASVKNGVSTRSGTFDVHFEKGDGVLEINVRDPGPNAKVIGFFIKSDLLN